MGVDLWTGECVLESRGVRQWGDYIDGCCQVLEMWHFDYAKDFGCRLTLSWR